MASDNLIAQVRRGMEVYTADNQKLGKVATVWVGTDPTANDPFCDEEICSRVEVHYGLLGRNALYVPYSALATVSSDRVTLNIDAPTANERAWNQKPRWLAD